MKKRLTNNLLLKIVSVLIAILVWAVVANVNDPIVSVPYNVPVTIINGAYIESIGKTYRVLEEEQDQKVRVVLRGKSSVVENRPIDDIEAIADLTNIVDMNTAPYVAVPVTVTSENIPTENITFTPPTIKIVLEDKANQEFIIGFDVTNKPDSKYAIGEITAKPEKVKIMGPTSLIQKIDRVVARVDVAGLSEDTTRTSSLVVYDKNQDALTQTSMSYLKFDIGEPVVEVNVDLWRIIPEVAIKVNYSGTPGAGYHVSNISSTPDHIGIAGTDEAIKNLRNKNNTIEIPAEEIDVTGALKDVEKKIDLTQFLPAETKIASDVATAIITVSVLPVGSKPFAIKMSDIEVVGLDETHTVVFDTDEITINVRGQEAVLAMLSDETVHAQIDLSGKGIGEHRIPINITLPSGGELLEKVDVGVEINELES